MALLVTGVFCAAMVLAGYAVELHFGATGLIPEARNAKVIEAGISWNYTTWLNLALPAITAILLVRFVRSGGLPMLKMLGGSPDADHGHHDDHMDRQHHGHEHH
jgi:uncharacterized membrane protein YraQ (UPF0718 family)